MTVNPMDAKTFNALVEDVTVSIKELKKAGAHTAVAQPALMQTFLMAVQAAVALEAYRMNLAMMSRDKSVETYRKLDIS